MNRRNLFYLIVSGVSLAAFAPSLAQADWVEDEVTKIRAWYNEIEGWKKRSETIEFESEGEPFSGTVTRYFNGQNIVKVTFSYAAGDHGGADESFYYRDGELFFAYVAQSYWQFTGEVSPNGESQTKDTMTEHRIYFSGGDCIRHLTKTASSVNPAEIKGLLQKTQNADSDDVELATEIYRRGRAIPHATTVEQIEALVF